MEEEKLARLDVREMALKCTTKAEVYKVLVTSGSIYLPTVDQTNGDFIRDILSGDKLVRHKFIFKYVDWNKVRIIEVPHIEGLRIPDLLKFAEKHWAIKNTCLTINVRSINLENGFAMWVSLLDKTSLKLIPWFMKSSRSS